MYVKYLITYKGLVTITSKYHDLLSMIVSYPGGDQLDQRELCSVRLPFLHKRCYFKYVAFTSSSSARAIQSLHNATLRESTCLVSLATAGRDYAGVFKNNTIPIIVFMRPSSPLITKLRFRTISPNHQSNPQSPSQNIQFKPLSHHLRSPTVLNSNQNITPVAFNLRASSVII